MGSLLMTRQKYQNAELAFLIIYINIFFLFKTRFSNPMPQSGFEITCWVLSHHGLLMLLDWGEDK